MTDTIRAIAEKALALDKKKFDPRGAFASERSVDIAWKLGELAPQLAKLLLKRERQLEIAREALEYYGNRMDSGGTARKAIDAIDKELVNPLNTSAESVKIGG